MVRPGSSLRDLATPITALQGELNRLIEQYWPPWAPGAPQDRPGAVWAPLIDLYETADDVVLLADLPGVDPSAIDLTVDGQILTLRGERASSAMPGDPGAGARRERPAGSFLRQVTLPSPVDADAVQASFQNGVLEVKLRKTESARARQIPIRPG
jgi:HSP20 family protein